MLSILFSLASADTWGIGDFAGRLISRRLLAWLGLGSYFILVNQGSQTSVLASLLAVRTTGTLALLIFAFLNKQL